MPLFPLVGFLAILVGGRKLGEPGAGCLATGDGARIIRCRRGASSPTCCRVMMPERSAVVADLRHGSRSATCRSTWRSSSTRCQLRHAAVRHGYRLADPPVFGRLHAWRPKVLEVLPLPQPVHPVDDPVGTRLQPAGDVPRLGRRRYLLLLPDLVLVRRRRQRHGRQEGLRDQPYW